ncbi:MAG: error-prone DNA polymerase, partial [Acidimicrobiales bacterium]|nr:error-prone DNA polymerase [Acidimicrobiales bacterium]
PVVSLTPYAELHCHSNFSFLDGASSPEELVEEAVRMGLQALAVTDRNGFYGIVRFAEAARAHGIATVFGAELTVANVGDLVILARGPEGYARLARAISEGQMAGEKGAPLYTLDRLTELSGWQEGVCHWIVLTGTWAGPVQQALQEDGPTAAQRVLDDLIERFGRPNVVVELWDHATPLCSTRNDALARLGLERDLTIVATNDVRYAGPKHRKLATALASVGHRRSLDEHDGWLPAAAAAHIRSGDEQKKRFERYPGVVEAAATLAANCAFDLKLVAPNLPPYPCPPEHDEMTWLRHLTMEGARRRYGPASNERIPGAYAQIDHELDLIEELGFPGYFLIVSDIVTFCRDANILCQGRGSAANSAVCYALGITNADAVALGLLFERFLSPERDGPPDIDIDIESDRREEVIQYVYNRYGREHAAQVANVITYRSKSAVRDMAKALGYAVGQQDAFSKNLDGWSSLGSQTTVLPADVMALATELEHAPRHLGIHSGGMVICDRPVVEVCPVEWARMENRSVLQWDKEDCAATGLVKFDLLGLGMLSAIHYAVDFVAENHGVELDLATLPQDPAVYDMLCRADTIGVFQIESRAQMATLPRLKPRTFYDLVVEIALIRPGPIQGGSVHPYIRRRNGQEEVTYLHPLLEKSLSKTLGIPLFQEQLMQMAIDVAGFTPAEADQLRQAMGSKRSRERMEQMQARLYDGMAERGIVGDVADELWEKLAAFANYGFPESHSVSFAYLVYSSSWLKRYYPAAFCAALLNAQPMGFYSPHSLVGDARRHGVPVQTPDINLSGAGATLEWPGCAPGELPDEDTLAFRPSADVHHSQWGSGGPAVRLGIGSVRKVGEDLAHLLDEGRPWSSIEDVKRRTGCSIDVLEALATSGAFDSLVDGDSSVARREALWAAGAASQAGEGRLEGIITGEQAPQLPGMTDRELALANLWATGVAPDGHPTVFHRTELDALGVLPSSLLPKQPTDSRVMVAGVITHRQRPATAGGTTFLNLEDEDGLINVVISKGCWARHKQVALTAPAVIVRGRVENVEGVTNVVADKLVEFALKTPLQSRNFR